MGVRFACHACQRRLNVKNELAGKKGKCPSCGSRFRIPVSDSDFSIPLDDDQAGADSGHLTPSGTSQEPLPDQQSAQPASKQPASNPPTPQTAPQQTAPEQTAPEQPVSERSASDMTAEGGASTAAFHRQTEPVPTPPPPAPPIAPAPKDLLDADPSALWYVRPPSGGQYGPATGRLLKEWIGEGRVAAASLLWREGWAQWRRAEEVLPHLLPMNETLAAGQATGSAQPAAATEVAAVEQPISSGHPGTVRQPSDLGEESAAATSQPPPPGRVKRQRKVRRVTTIGILVGLSVLLLIVLIFVIIGGFGE